MKIEVQKNKRGKWFWRIRAGNGKILCHSEDYANKFNCMKTVWLMRDAEFVVYENDD